LNQSLEMVAWPLNPSADEHVVQSRISMVSWHEPAFLLAPSDLGSAGVHVFAHHTYPSRLVLKKNSTRREDAVQVNLPSMGGTRPDGDSMSSETGCIRVLK
jgi:hypothetical protein